MRYSDLQLKDPVWSRQDWESDKQFQAFTDFLSLPLAYRSVKRLHTIYMEILDGGDSYVPVFSPTFPDDSKVNQVYVPPSTSEGTLQKWSTWFQWAKRAAAYEDIQTKKLEAKREEEFEKRLEKKVQTEFDQVEEFRSSMVGIGRSMVAYGSYIMHLLDTTTRVYPLGQALDDKAIARLKDVAFIYRACCTDGIPKGQEVWAQGLGIQDAIDVLAQTEAQESG